MLRLMSMEVWIVSWAKTRHSIPVSRRVWNCINMVSMRNVVDVGRRVRNVGGTSVPMVHWPESGMRHSVDMRRCMRHGVYMIPVWDVVGMCRRMRHVMEMSFLMKALSVCHLYGT